MHIHGSAQDQFGEIMKAGNPNGLVGGH